MTERALLDMTRQVPLYKRQELYEMIDFINDVGMHEYAV